MSMIEGWHTSRFDEVGTIYSGSTPPTTNKSFWNGDVVWVTPYDLSRLNTPYLYGSAKRITAKGVGACSTNLLPPRSLVMSTRAPIGYLAIPAVEFCTNQGCKSLTLANAFDPEFTYYNVLFNMDKVKNLGEGTTFAEISKAALSTVEMDFPKSKPEQTKIAEILSTVDRAIEQTEALIAKQQRIKTGLMQDLLTRGIDADGNLRTEQTHEFKDSPLGRIPVEWDCRSLDWASTNIVDCPHTTPNFLLSGVLVVRTFNIKDGKLAGEFSHVSELEYESRIARLAPLPGDLIFTREAPVGEAFVIPHKLQVCLGQRTMQIRCDLAKLLPAYLLEAIYSEDMKIHFDQMVGGTTNPHLNVSDVRSLLLRIPGVHEQLRLTNHIGCLRDSLSRSELQLAKLITLKTALMQDLLTGRKRVTVLLADPLVLA